MKYGVGAVIAAVFVLAGWIFFMMRAERERSRGRDEAARPPTRAPDPPFRPPPDEPPPEEPPEEPPYRPPDPPPDGTKAARGWRFGEDSWKGLLEKAPEHLAASCGRCHSVPPPDVATRERWIQILALMKDLTRKDKGPMPTARQWEEIQQFYITYAPQAFEPLPAGLEDPKIRLARSAIGRPRPRNALVTNVNVTDLDRDGKPDILVSDAEDSSVNQIRRTEKGWEETALATCTIPGPTAVADMDADGDLDVVVAGLGHLYPTDNPTGYVTILRNGGDKGWTADTIARDLPRIADARPADFDGDGDLDLAIGAFGWRTTGFVGWLRRDADAWTPVRLHEKPGAIHVPVLDLDADGRPDFVALVSQDTEAVIAFLNDGKGSFTQKKLFAADNPLFGLSGIQPVDLDRDGDVDFLVSNGDALDDDKAEPKPFHGIQWLENKGQLEFTWHDIGRCNGPYRAVAADLDADGDLDVAVAVMFDYWKTKTPASLHWWENDGKQAFVRRDLAKLPAPLVTLDAADLDGDKDIDLVAGLMGLSSMGANGEGVTLWSNGGLK